MSKEDERHPTENPTAERLTKEREAEIRAYYRGEAQSSYYVPPDPGDYALADVRDLLAELDALRAAPPTTYLHANGTEEPIGELVARLTRERDEALVSAEMWSDNAKASTVDLSRAMARAERAEARVREMEPTPTGPTLTSADKTLDEHAERMRRLDHVESITTTKADLVLVIHALMERLRTDTVELSNDELLRASDRCTSHDLLLVTDQSRLLAPVHLKAWPWFDRTGGSHG